MKKTKPYRKIRKALTEEQVRDMLAKAYAQRQNCMEELMTIRLGGVTNLIYACCRQSPDDMVDEAKAQIAWLDKRIEDLQRFLPRKTIITDLMG